MLACPLSIILYKGTCKKIHLYIIRLSYTAFQKNHRQKSMQGNIDSSFLNLSLLIEQQLYALFAKAYFSASLQKKAEVVPNARILQ